MYGLFRLPTMLIRIPMQLLRPLTRVLRVGKIAKLGKLAK